MKLYVITVCDDIELAVKVLSGIPGIQRMKRSLHHPARWMLWLNDGVSTVDIEKSVKEKVANNGDD